MDKNAKQMKDIRAKQEETALNRVLCWICGGAVLEFLLLLLDRYYNHYTVDQIELRVALGTGVKILAVAALACAAAAGYWWNNARKNGKGANLPGVLTLFMVGISASCFAAWFFSGMGLRLMYIGVPVVVALALVYYLYQREFFLVACMAVLGFLGTWIASRALGGAYGVVAYLYTALTAAILLAAALLGRKLQGAGGTLEVKGQKQRLLPKDANYAFLYTAALVTLAVLVAGILAAPAMILYGVLTAWVLIMAVYYTVKLM